MKVLLVVESPTKARTLKTYLGKGFFVIASKGHIKDLPEKDLGIDLNTFSPKYEVLKGRYGIINLIRNLAKNSDLVLLGSDPDREGEAIAYHIFEEIKVLKRDIKRVLFFEITPEGVKSAIKNPTDIDLRKVESQKARRVLDRLVGYMISPILWKRLRWGLSAGRVQSAALRLIVEREREIRSFVPKTFWYFEVEIEKKGKVFKVRSEKNFFDEREAREIYEKLKVENMKVIEFGKKIVKQNPPPPLKTSTLQQEANRLFGLSAEKTMRIAQTLYEGVEINGKRVGLITYHRTDSTRLSERGINLIRNTIISLFGEGYLSKTKRTYGKDKGSGAHEAIRPTYPEIKPWDLKGQLDELSLKVYELIWRRAVASQMPPMEYELVEVKISSGGIKFIAEGKRVKFDGWTRVLPQDIRGEEIPELRVGETLKAKNIKLKKDKTKPKPRFTEASLVEELERLGIGRPSTYATIIKTLFARKYVIRKGKALVPTEMGEKVIDELLRLFPEILDYNFTAKMEEELDKIEEGEKGYLDVVKSFYMELWPKIEKANGRSHS